MVTTRSQASFDGSTATEDQTGSEDFAASPPNKNGAGESQCRLEYKGQWFDVSKFAEKHPGGADVLREAASGKDIGGLLSGDESLNGLRHKHSDNAYRILEKYAENKGQQDEGSESGLIDLEKPILAQVGSLGGHYWKWIHTPIEKDLRMFESDKLEWLTRNRWHTIPAIWMPLVTLFAWISFGLFNAEYSSSVALFWTGFLFLFGMLLWTLMEYLLHRYGFHWIPPADSPKLIVFHFILHGLHHKSPMDGGRLVFPPLMASVIVAVVFLVYRSLFSWQMTVSIGAGHLFGYICYDMIHYYLHHGVPSPGSYFHELKHYHHAHHYKNPDLTVVGMYLRYYLDDNGKRVYTLQKVDPAGKPTVSAHPARFSPEDQYSRQRITIKRRFGLLPTQQAKPTY